jgi:4-hydroxybenzoate polyprenyltransferase
VIRTDRSWRGDLLGVLAAARMNKNLSAGLLVLGGALAVGRPSAPALVLALAIVLLAAAFATQLNVITDRGLDVGWKRRYFTGLARNRRLAVAIMAAELGLAVLGILALLASGYGPMASVLALFVLFALLYAYNFLRPADPEGRRWKTVWWKHALAFVGGYTALWCTGALAVPAAAGRLGSYVALFAAAAVSEYAFYLAEAARDAPEERGARLRTLASLLGRRSTTRLAFVVSLLAGLALWLLEHPDHHRAFSAGAAVRTVFVLPLLWEGERDRRGSLLHHLPDYVFHVARLLTVALLLW